MTSNKIIAQEQQKVSKKLDMIIRLKKWLVYYHRSFFENIIYYDMMGSALTCLMNYLDGKYYVEVKDL